MEERWDNGIFDFNAKREEAAKVLIIEGISTRREWLETLEHIGEERGGEFKPGVKPNASLEVKTRRLKDNEQRLRNTLLSDEDDCIH